MSVEDTTVHRDGGGCHDGFEPIPYTFRIPDKWNKVDESAVVSPPNWLLLDHTIAVVWSLFSSFSPARALDIDDLKWAHEYLKEVRNAKGENPPDVKTCLTVIQDRLIAQYAQLTRKDSAPLRKSDDDAIVVVKPAAESMTSEDDSNVVEFLPIATDDVPKKETRTGKEPTKNVLKSEGNATRKTSTAVARKNVVAQQRRAPVTTSKARPIPAKRSESTRKEKPKKDDSNASVENFFTDVFERNKNSDRILGSHNLVRRKTTSVIRSTLSNEGVPESNVKNDSIQSREDDGKISLQFKKWITEEETNQNEEKAYRNLKNEIRNLTKNPKISKDEVLKFLSNWREEQVERLQSELKRLNSIEEFMKSFKMEGFVPYVPQDLTEKLESITYKKELNKLS